MKRSRATNKGFRKTAKKTHSLNRPSLSRGGIRL